MLIRAGHVVTVYTTRQADHTHIPNVCKDGTQTKNWVSGIGTVMLVGIWLVSEVQIKAMKYHQPVTPGYRCHQVLES